VHFPLLVLLKHAQEGVRLQYVEPASKLIVKQIHSALVEATAKTLIVCYDGLIVPTRIVYDLNCKEDIGHYTLATAIC